MPGSSILTYWMLIDRQMQSDFMSELHRWDFEFDRPPPTNSSPGGLLIAMVKETVILYKKRVSKNEKKSYLSLI